MVRSKSVMPWVQADQHFPVRIRVSGPPKGFGQQLNEMHHWLHERVGLRRFYQWGKMTSGPSDDLLFYFDDLDVAREFVTRFECAVLVRGEAPR